jgi:hypothetical protein
VRGALAHLPSRAGGPAAAAPAAGPAARRSCGRPARAGARRLRRARRRRPPRRRRRPARARPGLGRNLVVGLARVDGAPVGVIANQPRHLGGTLDADASQKGAWFVELCDRFGVPLVVLVDTPGFLPGTARSGPA